MSAQETTSVDDRWLRVTYARPEPEMRRGLLHHADGVLVQVLEFAPRDDRYMDSMSILQEAMLNDDVDWIQDLPTSPGFHEGWICTKSLANHHENPDAWWEPIQKDQDVEP